MQPSVAPRRKALGRAGRGMLGLGGLQTGACTSLSRAAASVHWTVSERRPGAAKAYRAALDTLLLQRNSDVDHLLVKVINQDRLPGQEVYPIEAGHTAHNQRREATIGDGHVVRQSCVNVEPDWRIGINGQQAGRHERASIWWRLDDCLVQRCVDVEQGRPRVQVEIVVRIRGPGEASRRRPGAATVVERRVGLGLARQWAGKRVPEVLASVADDPEGVGGWIKVYAEEVAVKMTVNCDTRVATAVFVSSV